MTLFESDPIAQEIRAKIEELDPETMTPIEALITLSRLKQKTAEDGNAAGDEAAEDEGESEKTSE